MSFKVGDKVSFPEYDPQGVIEHVGEITEIVQQEPLYKIKTTYGISGVMPGSKLKPVQAGGRRVNRPRTRRMKRK